MLPDWALHGIAQQLVRFLYSSHAHKTSGSRCIRLKRFDTCSIDESPRANDARTPSAV
jgi:hypothetical protein